MPRLATLFLLLALGSVLSGSPALAQDIRINPVPPGLKPQWTKVPEAPQVSWAPNLPTDVFRYRKQYYFFWEGYFYQGRSPEGPWQAVQQVPQVFYNVDPAYFKTAKPAEETPPPEQAAPEHKAKVIDIPPATPRSPSPPVPAEPEPAPQGGPGPQEPQRPAPRVM